MSLAAGLVDRYHLLVFPVLLGSGKRLFGGMAPCSRTSGWSSRRPTRTASSRPSTTSSGSSRETFPHAHLHLEAPGASGGRRRLIRRRQVARTVQHVFPPRFGGTTTNSSDSSCNPSTRVPSAHPSSTPRSASART